MMSSPGRGISVLTVAACLILAGGARCAGSSSGHLQIHRAQAPADFRSLGRTDMYVEIQGTGRTAVEVSLPLSTRESFWFLPETLRLAWWNERSGTFEVLPDSRFDRKTRLLTGIIQTDGIYTALGLSRVNRVLAAQIEICRFKRSSHVWPGCREILCVPMDIDSSAIGWSDSLGSYADELEAQFGGVCEKCLSTWVASDFPECEIFPAAIDTGGLVVIPPGDTDHDGLDDTLELELGTSPGDPDTDDDGLRDGWEVLGYDSDGDGNLDVDLPGMGVVPLHKDILVEADWMFVDGNGNGIEDPDEMSYRPTQGAIDYVVQRFAEGPVQNPDGSTGIQLIVNVSNGLPEVDLYDRLVINGPNNQQSFSTLFYDIKDVHMTPGMAAISRYCLWIDSFAHHMSGQAEYPGPSDDFVVSLGQMTPPGGTEQQQQATFMHELGHTLALKHGGSEDRNYEPNYPSVMNFFHQFSGVVGEWVYDLDPDCDSPWCSRTKMGRLCFFSNSTCVWTYSRGALDPVDEKSLSEQEGISILPVPIDWNFDGTFGNTLVSVDLQGDGELEVQTDHDDWSNLVLPF
jgi:hypothetical protein